MRGDSDMDVNIAAPDFVGDSESEMLITSSINRRWLGGGSGRLNTRVKYYRPLPNESRLQHESD